MKGKKHTHKRRRSTGMRSLSSTSNRGHDRVADDTTVDQDADQDIEDLQVSEECIIIRNSADVEVHTTDTQAAVNLQAALQVAIALVLSLTIADSDKAEAVTQDLLQKIETKQINKQKTLILNSQCVRVTTTDTDIAVNIQALLQVLVALVAKIDVL
ncbi:spore coat protein [Tumebacillus sp. DT12]|uniref:Spore coat protein n=1 Tax=Tumebacillus lacus TaxID=2995335 RepID=A0ABT3WZG2_9BACL|nr:spore coat protein [Tumebacillus lacus]MCX7570031.1 spore coat protein [Tumebacillus lacus]